MHEEGAYFAFTMEMEAIFRNGHLSLKMAAIIMHNKMLAMSNPSIPVLWLSSWKRSDEEWCRGLQQESQ